MDEIIGYTLFALGVILLLSSVLQLTTRNKTRINYQMSFMFILFSYFLFYDWLSHINILEKFPKLMYSDIPVSLILGPAIYLFTRNITGGEPSARGKLILLFTPGVLVSFCLLLFNPGGDILKAGSLFPNGHRTHLIIFVVSMISDIQLFLYILASTLSTRKAITLKTPDYTGLKRLIIFYYILLSSFLLFFSAYIIYDERLIGIGLIIDGINAVYLFLLTYRYPELTKESSKTPRQKNRSQISGSVEVAEIIEKLNYLMATEKIYRHQDLTSQALSNSLGIKNHQLSIILNNYMNTTFRGLVNSHRLDEAKTLLLEDRTKSILEIGYCVGFNSKSAFNHCFQKEAGMSPKEYRNGGTKTVPPLNCKSDGTE